MESSAFYKAYTGSLLADAFAMPVHWYYNTAALDRDYPALSDFQPPRNPHPDSILWRSSYQPLTPAADILHDQAQYWGQAGVHYHQFLRAGENTVNFKLAAELYQQVTQAGKYDPEKWLECYIAKMREPGWHGDTYVEEYHRAFFNRLASGKKPLKCGINDKHIGGLSQVPALVAALIEVGVTDVQILRKTVCRHIELTHQNRDVIQAGDVLVQLLAALAEGTEFEDALQRHANGVISLRQFNEWQAHPDRAIVGRVLSPACYIEDSFPAALYLAWKYQHDFKAGIQANALVGGDNCHRGAVVGSLLGLMNDPTL